MPLPIDELLPRLVTTLAEHPSVVVQAPPGAGKTTRVPLELLNAPWLCKKKIIMLEPRRIAARAAARFMATTLGERVGETVGYRVRLDNKTGPKTRIEIVTEGVLTRLLQNDPALDEYGVVIFDEFHERNLHSDLGLALCIDSQQGLREDLKIIVMSATLDGVAVSKLLGDAPMLTSEGRSYPVMIRHLTLNRSFTRERRAFLEDVAQRIRNALKEEPGSVLVFLPGAAEIRLVHATLQEALLDTKGDNEIVLAPLFGKQTSAEQDAAIQPPPVGKRKIVLASAIAETSLTIEGIRIVIDAGLMRIPRLDPNTGLKQLVTVPVSQASADQRCGRAGRLQAGVCYRLWNQGTHLLAQTPAEILDADLAPLLLELARWGVSDVNALRWLDPPPAPHVALARDLLTQLSALDPQGRITAHGRAMAQWAVHPRLSHMMLRAKAIGTGALACEVAAILSDRDILRGIAIRESDLQLRVEALRDRAQGYGIDRGALREARKAAEQWQQRLEVRPDPSSDDLHLLGVVLAYAYPDRIGSRRGNSMRYLLSNGRGAFLIEGDPLCTQEFIVAAHLEGAREARIFLAAGIRREHLLQYHDDNISTHSMVQWDDRNDCVQARAQQRFGALVIDETPLQEVDPEAVIGALLEGIRLRGLSCLPWSEAARALQARIQFMREHLDPDYLEPEHFEPKWPDVSDAVLLSTLDTWLKPYLANMSRLSHLERLDLYNILLAQLSWEQTCRLNELLPTHITVPSGSRIQVDYTHFPPVLAVRLQEMFGLADTPRIAEGRITVLLHLLSPAQRPVQITQDLATFWQGSYHEVKKDMKGRYPKHHWPDNPLEAQATKRTKRKGE